MNKHDSERLAGLLESSGFKEVEKPEEANVIVFNTCSVRKHAEERLYGALASVKGLKKKKELKIAVGGCTAQKEKEKILKRAPFVDIVFGTFDLPRFLDLLQESEIKSPIVSHFSGFLEKLPTDLPLKRKSEVSAWVPISIGCNNFCSYCIVPYVRGPEISRPFEEICKEVCRLADEGVVEITLLGQNVNSYGRDIYGEPRFAELLLALNEVEGIKRIRFTTSHPKDLTNDVVEAVARGEKICEHFHLPLQAGSTKILKAMKREYAKEDYIGLCEEIRNRIPDAAITTDIMVGFPGESEEDFEETVDVVRKVQFDQAFTFIFSPREGTPAAEMKEKIPQEIKKKRFSRLVELTKKTALARNKAMVGMELEILVEGKSKKDSQILRGRARSNKVVNFKGDSSLVNQFVKVRIVEAYPFHLRGEIKAD